VPEEFLAAEELIIGIFNPVRAKRFAGEIVRENPRKVSLVQSELIPNHHESLPVAVNHNATVTPTTSWIRT
jgi:hypothetical protein